jgi:amino acid transporter/mannitol/fructose-specific phosphotransferase system IIA component (Ntr-type)/nucleotide-binding universal stress UspA family protein
MANFSNKPGVTKELKRNLGFMSVFSIAVGAMLGSGIFVLPGLAASIAGPWVSLSYMLAGLLVLPAVMSKAELATAMPVAGGTYVYVDRSMGPWLGTITGIGTWLALSAKTAFALVGLGAYLVLFSSVPALPVALAILVALLSLNAVGAGKVSGIQVVIVSLTLIALVIFAVFGVPAVVIERFTPAFPAGAAGILTGAGFVFVSYSGVTKICFIAEEVKNPSRNIPLGMLVAQFTVMALYALLSWIMVGVLEKEDLAVSLTPVATAAGSFLGPTGKTVFAVVAIIGLISMCNAGILATTRFPFAMSRDNIFPPRFQKISERFGTPIPAIVLTGVVLITLVVALPVTKLAKLASVMQIFCFCIVNFTLIVLRETEPKWYRPSFRTPLYPWTQLAGIIGGVWLLWQLGAVAISGVTAAVLTGSIWYFAYARKRVQRRSAVQYLMGQNRSLRATELAELDDQRSGSARRVVVPVFGGEPAAQRMMRVASGFVDDGVLDVIRYEELPEAAELTSRLNKDIDASHITREADVLVQDSNIAVEFQHVVTYNSKEALQRHALSTRTEWIVMEWPTQKNLRRLVRDPLAWWTDNPPCDLAIFLDRQGEFDGDTSDDFPRVLIYARPGPYDSLLAHVGDRLARTQQDGEITFINILPEGSSERDVADLQAYHTQLGGLCSSPTHSRVEFGKDEAAVLAAISNDFDILVLSAPPEQGLRTVFFGSLQHRIAESVKCSVLKVKAPRHRVHHRLHVHEDESEKSLELFKLVEQAQLGLRLPFTRQPDLILHAADQLSTKVGLDTSAVKQALETREREQSTALAEGVALTGPVIPGLETPVIGVFTTERQIDWAGPTRLQIDVLIVVLASPAHRQAQLWLLEGFAQMKLRGGLLSGLRAAQSQEDLLEGIMRSAAKVDLPVRWKRISPA